MALLAIEINDVGIRAVRAGEPELLAVDGDRTSSPGFAQLAKKKPPVTGAAAAGLACVQPLSVNSRFWDRLDTQPVDSRIPKSPNRAEVACAHMVQIVNTVRRPGDEVVLAVSPGYDDQQLGIVAGIAGELGLPVQGLVASPVAIDIDPDHAGTILVVELGLHRCVVSALTVNERTTLERARVCPDVGLDAFRRQWIRAIGAEFVRSTRFDPLHDAATEQQLDDHLPLLLAALERDGSLPLELRAGDVAHRVIVSDQLVANAGHGLVFALCAELQAIVPGGTASAVLLAHDAALVPGLARTIRQQLAVPVHAIEEGAAARGLARDWPDRYPSPPEQDGAGLAYHTWRSTSAGGEVPTGSEATGTRS